MNYIVSPNYTYCVLRPKIQIAKNIPKLQTSGLGSNWSNKHHHPEA